MKTRQIALLLGLALAVVGCSKADDSKPAADPKPVAPAPTKSEAPAVDSAAALSAIEAVMAPYEQCRVLLADDKGAGIADCAQAMADSASKGSAAVGAPAKAHMDAIAAAAKKLAAMPADDVEAIRLADGTVSEPVVALLTASPEAAVKYHVFECPMAKGYKRWAQPEAKLANPYMGTKMLACGSEVHDHHQGVTKGGHDMGGHDKGGHDKGGHEMKHN